ncbi:MAG: ABC transporter permease subunit [Planctomycetota bacterium]
MTRKYLSEGVLLLVGLSIGILTFCWFRVWIVGELDTAQFRQIIDLLPKNWRQFATVDFDWLVSYLGRTSLTLDEPMLITLVCAWGLVRSSDVVSGELGRGTMEMLAAQPISRRRIYLHHAILTTICLTAMVALAWFGMSMGIWTTSVEETTYPELRIPIFDYRIPLTFLAPQVNTIAMSSQVSPIAFLPGVANLFCVAFCFAGFAALCSAMDRYRWRTIGIVAAFFFGNAGLKILGMGSEKLSWVENCTLFGLYHPASAIERAQSQPGSWYWIFEYNNSMEIQGLGGLPHCLILLAIGISLYWIGLIIFEKRDLPAPM